MVKSSTLLLILLILFSSCNSNLKNRIAELEQENEYLKTELLNNQKRDIFEIVNNIVVDQNENIPIERAKTLTESIELIEHDIVITQNESIILKKDIILKSILDLENSIVSIKEYLIEQNGGYNNEGWINNSKETNTVNEIMINMGKGEAIHSKLLNCISIINREVELTEIQAKELPLRYNLDFKRDDQMWHEFTFGNMPIGATIPIFTKLKNDCNASRYYILNILKEKL